MAQTTVISDDSPPSESGNSPNNSSAPALLNEAVQLGQVLEAHRQTQSELMALKSRQEQMQAEIGASQSALSGITSRLDQVLQRQEAQAEVIAEEETDVTEVIPERDADLAPEPEPEKKRSVFNRIMGI